MDEEDFSTKHEIDAFEKKLKKTTGRVLEESDSSEEEAEIVPGTQSEEVQRLRMKVGLIMQELVDKETELSSLKQSLQLTKLDDDLSAPDPKGKKLIELARKNRALQVSLESEKNRSARAMAEVIRLQEIVNQVENSKGWKRPKIVTQEEDYKQKFTAMEKSYQDLKLKHHTNKEELTKALKVIRMEVGEYESLSKLIANEGWRGRAQTIDGLRAKVRDLERQLASAKAATGEPSEISITPKADMGSAEERRREITSLKEALEVTTAECEGWKKKAQGALNRKAVLEEDMRKLRENQSVQLKALLEKSETDDKYINSLKEELDKTRRSKGVPVKIKTSSTTSAGQDDPISQLKMLKARVYTLETELKEKDEILEMFKLQKEEGEIEGSEEYLAKIHDLQEEINQLKSQNMEVMRERTQTSSEEAKIIKDLSVQNARLRKKADDLEQQLAKAKK